MIKKIDWKFVKFLFVGGVNTLFGYSVSSFLLYIKIHYSLASLLAIIIGIAFNYQTYSKFVFNNQNPFIIFRFAIVYFFLYVTSIIWFWIFDRMEINLILANTILLPLKIFILFVLLNRFVFSTAAVSKK